MITRVRFSSLAREGLLHFAVGSLGFIHVLTFYRIFSFGCIRDE